MSDYPRKNLRDIEITGNSGKDVNSTKMLDAVARETPDTVTGDNPQYEYVTPKPNQGPLGNYGRH